MAAPTVTMSVPTGAGGLYSGMPSGTIYNVTTALITVQQADITAFEALGFVLAPSFGGGVAQMGGQGNINKQCPGVAGGVAPGATGADNVVLAYSLPAGSLDQALRMFWVEAWVQFAANANTKRAKLIFNPATAVVGSTVGAGGVVLADTGAITQSGGSALLQGGVVKRGNAGANTQTVLPGGVLLSGSHVGLTTPNADAAAVESGAILVALTINNTTTATDALGVALQVNAMN